MAKKVGKGEARMRIGIYMKRLTSLVQKWGVVH